MTRPNKATTPATGDKRTWQRRALRLARLLGARVTDVRPGAVLVSRADDYSVKAVVPDEAFLVQRLGRAGARPRKGANVAKLGKQGLLVSPRDVPYLTLETQTMQYFGTRHVAWLLHHQRVDCVFDVGANKGQFARSLRRNGYRGHIVSFEPVPEFVTALAELSAADDKWTVHQLALGSTEGTVPMRVQRTFSSLLETSEYGKERFATLREYADAGHIDVPLRRLDSIFDELVAPVVASGVQRPRVFLKLDTQGFDLEVFRGLGDRAADVIGLQSEVALLLIYEQMPSMREALAVYEESGFEITGFFPVTREPDGRVIEYDCVMVRPTELLT